jgi:NAD(P)H-dependent flavin oxidoreductase YrpB (nitropropane dioxygenase family)
MSETPDPAASGSDASPPGSVSQERGADRAPAPQNAAGAARHPALRTRACELFGVELPIVQTGMGWVSGAQLTAATAAAGGLGILASATMTFEELRAAIGKVKARTDKPFGVNLLPNQPDAAERIGLIISEQVPVASFAAAPKPDQVARLNDAGVVTIVTVGAKRHAEKVAAMGVKAVIAQGGEGGGHTGSVPTSLLLPQVADGVAGSDVVVLGAGGFFDGRGLVAALAYGADGIAMGTRFLLTAESQVPDNITSIYLQTPLTGTVVTTAIDGAPQRVIRTAMIEALEKSPGLVRFPRAAANAVSFARSAGVSLPELARTGLQMRKDQELTWAQVALAANAPMMTKASVVDGDAEVGILPTGQVVGAIEDLPPVAELLARIMDEADATLTRLSR